MRGARNILACLILVASLAGCVYGGGYGHRYGGGYGGGYHHQHYGY